MVLDSNVDPRNVFYQANHNQDVAFNTVIKIWFGWLANYDNVYHLGKTEKAVEALFYQTEAKLALHPADGKIGGDDWGDIFLPTGYSQATSTLLGDAFARFIHNDDVANLEDLFLITDGLGNDNFYAVYNAVPCTDVQWPQQWSTWSRDNWATFAKAPFETWANACYNAPCLYWPAPAHKPLTAGASSPRSGATVSRALWTDARCDHDAERRGGRHHSLDIPSRAVEQRRELPSSAFAPAGHHQHVQVHQPSWVFGRRLGQNRLDNRHPSAGTSGFAHPPQDRLGPLVVPVVKDELQYVKVAVLGHGLEEVARDTSEPVAQFARDPRGPAGDHFGEIQDDASSVAASLEQPPQQAAVTAADVDRELEFGEGIGVEDRVLEGAGRIAHGLRERAPGIRMGGEIVDP
jgi:hypothetical protein